MNKDHIDSFLSLLFSQSNKELLYIIIQFYDCKEVYKGRSFDPFVSVEKI